MIVFANSYAGLPARLYTLTAPTPVVAPRLIKFNWLLAAELGFDLGACDAAQLASIFAGNTLLPGSTPLAAAYAGHQFGQFVPQLGDGRAVLLGEVVDRQGRLRDIQLKGSGRTPYSRGGDGRAALGPVLREYLVSEALHALGLPTTRALAAVSTGEPVLRERRLPGAVVTRIAASHVRVGTFQYAAARDDTDAVKQLADFVIERHYPLDREAPNPYIALLRSVVRRQAELIAGWMSVGFIHGVMNTDNMAISGETIDFGPCAFMDAYDAAAVFSAIDRGGRYAYSNQPAVAQWNLARFAETLLPLIDVEPERAIDLATAEVVGFEREYSTNWLARMRGKLGLTTAEPGDGGLIQDFLDIMQRTESDFTATFRALVGAHESLPDAFAAWLARWRTRFSAESITDSERAAMLRAVNPAFIPRNHRIEAAIAAAAERDDFTPFEELSAVLSRPFEEQPRFAIYGAPPLPEERVLQTFCGT